MVNPRSSNITRQASANTGISAKIYMITKFVKKVIVIEVNAPKDTLKNAEDSRAIWNVGLMKVVPTNTHIKPT